MDSFPSTSAFLIVIALAVVIWVLFSSPNALVARKGDERVPPTLPYALPLIGHLVQFLWNTEGLLAEAATRYGPDTPVQLRLLNRRLTIMNGPSNITKLFKGSRVLSSERWLVQALVNAFGIEKADAPFYLADNTGIGSQPQANSNPIPHEHRVFHHVYQGVHDGLSGERLEEMQRQLIRNLSAQLAAADIGHDTWTEVPDLYGSFFRKMCFTAAINSLCGPRIFEAAPSLEPDFWDFDAHLPNLFKEIPQWLVPASYRARNKMIENIKRWHELANQGYDITQSDTEKRNWEENFGSKLMRTRQAFYLKMPLSKHSIAADDLGLLWAATANSVPAIGWMLLEVLQRPELLDRVRAEIAPHMAGFSGDKPLEIDIDGLCQGHLVQSIYAEVLRAHNGTVVARVPEVSNFSIAGWVFPKDNPILVSTFDTARVSSVWNQGTPNNPHPVDEFWPERFIVDPKDPLSGPVLPDLQTQSREASHVETDAKPSEPYFSLEGTTGSWVPYGGGSRMCPGRHFAKKELIVTMAIFLTAFDIELAPRDGWIQDDMTYFMFGVMHPKGPISARIRRRKPDH